MPFDTSFEAQPSAALLLTAADVATILQERVCLEPLRDVDTDAPWTAWCTRAADLLGPHAVDRAALADLLSLIFGYDAQALLREARNQAVLAREGAREVVRESGTAFSMAEMSIRTASRRSSTA